MSVNGRHYPRAERGLEDDGAIPERRVPCAVRTENGGHCYLDDGHAGAHESKPLRYDHPQRPIDQRVMAKPPRPPKSPTPAAEVVWPDLGTRYRDDAGRVLTITAVNPRDPVERHIVGVIDAGIDYACSRLVFDALWRIVGHGQ